MADLHPNNCYAETFDAAQLEVYESHRAIDAVLEKFIRDNDDDPDELNYTQLAASRAQEFNIAMCEEILIEQGVNPNGCVGGLALYLAHAFAEYSEVSAMLRENVHA